MCDINNDSMGIQGQMTMKEKLRLRDDAAKTASK